MFYLVINVFNDSNQRLSADEIIQKLIIGSKNKPAIVVFSPDDTMDKKTLGDVLPRFPKTCIGLQLRMVASLENTEESIEWLEALCALLPPHLRILDASCMIHYSVSYELKIRFMKALPKTLDLLNLYNNHLSYGLNQSQLCALLANLQGARGLDLRENNVPEPGSGENYKPISYIPSSCTTLYTELKESSKLTKNLLKTLPPQVNILGIEGYQLTILHSFEKHIPPTLTTLRLLSLPNTLYIIPRTFSTLDLTGCGLNETFSLANIPPYVTTLILDNLSNSLKTAKQWLTMIQSIPLTVTHVSLKGNNIFRNRKPQQRDEMLRALQPYNQNGRLNLLDNCDDDWARAALPLINGVEQNIVPNMDCAFHIATFLGAKSLTLFCSLQRKTRVIQHEVNEIKETQNVCHSNDLF
ncbi:MAG: hypothetical protein Q8M40_13480 [Legionella sp.]|nr:hypothetical protein [Legionella sp.]